MPFADLPCVRLHYIEAGQGPALLLLHGLGADWQDWEAQIPAFAPFRRVIAPDLRGFGASDRPGSGYCIEQFASDCWALFDTLGIRRTALLGHSMGGAVALQMTLDRPQSVERLMMANSVPSFRPNSIAARGEIMTRRLLMRLFGPRWLARLSARRMFPRPDQRALRSRVIRRAETADRDAYLAALKSLTQWDVRDRLPGLDVPTLVLASQCDYFASRDQEAFVKALPRGGMQVFPGARHGLPMERPAEFNAAVLRFLGCG